MNQRKTIRIDVQAAQALVRWKESFAQKVCDEATRIAAESLPQATLNLEHYRQAVPLALRSLSEEILQGARDDDRKAA